MTMLTKIFTARRVAREGCRRPMPYCAGLKSEKNRIERVPIKAILSIKTGTNIALNQDLEGGRKPKASRLIRAADRFPPVFSAAVRYLAGESSNSWHGSSRNAHNGKEIEQPLKMRACRRVRLGECLFRFCDNHRRSFSFCSLFRWS